MLIKMYAEIEEIGKERIERLYDELESINLHIDGAVKTKNFDYLHGLMADSLLIHNLIKRKPLEERLDLFQELIRHKKLAITNNDFKAMDIFNLYIKEFKRYFI